MAEKWDKVITSKSSFLKDVMPELFKSGNLIYMLVKRDFKTMYKQTFLGPLWIILRPLLSAGIFALVFSYIAGLSTNSVPDILFYMSGSILWSLFSGILLSVSSTFFSNYDIFSKVYFQRMATPVATAISKIMVFLIQFSALLLIYLGYLLKGAAISPNLWAFITPLFLVHISLLAVGLGLIFASVTIKYRDLSVLISFGTSFLMYLTPVVYPICEVPESIRGILLLNPVAPVIEGMRYGLFSTGEVMPFYLVLSLMTSVAIFVFGVCLFNKTQKNFVDLI